MEIMKPIMNGLAILMAIGGGAIAIMENMVLGSILFVLAMLFMIASNLAGISSKLNDLRLPVSMQTPIKPHNLFRKPAKTPEITIESQPDITLQPTPMPIQIEKPVIPTRTTKIEKDALEAKKLAEEAILNSAIKAREEAKEAIQTAEEKLEEPPMPPVAPTFTCKRCTAKGVEKVFTDEKRLKRHIGMAHYQDLEV